MEEYKQIGFNINKSLLEEFLKLFKELKNEYNLECYNTNSEYIKYLIRYCFNLLTSDEIIKELNKFKSINIDNSVIYFRLNLKSKEYEEFKKYKNTITLCTFNQVINSFMFYFINEIEKNKEKATKNIIILNNKIKSKEKNYKQTDTIIMNFPKEILDYKLNMEEEKIIIRKLEEVMKGKNVKALKQIDTYYFLSNLYKMQFIFKYASSEIAQCFNRDIRVIQTWLKSINWNIDSYEAQQRASDRLRDYKQIRLKSKETLSKRVLVGSNPEDYIRHKFNLSLPLYFNEVIVGLNNLSILDNGKEIDIPIIIIQDNNIYKFAVEVNGDIWHQDNEKENLKTNLAKGRGYKLFYILLSGNTRIQKNEYGKVDEQIDNIIKQISKEINKNI